MRRIFTLGAALVAALLFTAPAEAQTTRAVPLGTNDTGAGVYYDTNTDTAYVSGWTTPASSDLPRVWAINSTDTITTNTLSLLSGGTHAVAGFFSPNGTYLGGDGDSTSYSAGEAIRWTFGSWASPTAVGVPLGSSSSTGADVSNSGEVFGLGGPAFCWSPMTTLPGLTGPFSSLTGALATRADGTQAVGYATTSIGVLQPVLWTNGSGWTLTTLTDPNGLASVAKDMSPNGSYACGESSSTSGTMACYWTVANSTFNNVPDDNGVNLVGTSIQVVNDGSVFGQGTFGTTTKAFLFTANMQNASSPSSKTLDTYYQENNNNVPGPTNFVEVKQVVHIDGHYHIVAKGSNGLWYYVQVPEDAGCQCTPICQWLHWLSKTFFGGNPPWWLQWYLNRYGCNGCC